MNTITINNYTAKIVTCDKTFAKYSIPGVVPAAMVDAVEGEPLPVIYVTTGFAELTAQSRNAFLTHEVGHIACGHVAQFGGTDVLIDNADIEAQADAWAARIVGSAIFDMAMDEALMLTLANLESLTNISGAMVEEALASVAQRKALRQKYM